MSNSNNKQPLDLTDYDGISQPDEASTTTPIIDPIGFLLGCAKRGENRNDQPPPTICKVSRVLRDLSENSFNPQLVSIGPLHKEDPKLQEFEWMKECYLDDLLHRCDSTPKETLEACLQKVNTLIPKIRESYAGVKKKYSDVELATMMVMDGCFILEFCFKHVNEDVYLPNTMQNSRIAMDLLLLENQVPFFVLEALLECSIGKEFHITLSEVLDVCLARYIMIFSSRSMSKEIIVHFDSDSTHDHVLGYLHKRYQHVAAKSSKPIHTLKSKPVAAKSSNLIQALKSKLVAAKSSNPIQALKSKLVAAKSSNPILPWMSKLVDKKGSKNTHIQFHSVVELDRSGINFKPHQEGGWSMTIKFKSSLFACLPWFWSKPTLLMPVLDIHDFTELILRNLIAYEQSFPQNRYYFTSYAHVMDTLINTQEDIAKLVESGVLVNSLGTNQEAADMINKICKYSLLTDFYYTKEFEQMDKYCKGSWPKHMARLRRIYFNNPWSAIALVAAIILFSLTVVQTIYAIKAK
ncbi:putative UPF0481 protein [Tanacetum coccineum]